MRELLKKSIRLIAVAAIVMLSGITLPKVHATTNLIPNQSVEVNSAEGFPTGWKTGSYGANMPIFNYLTADGQNGTKSLRVTLSSYSSGDAKWYFTPITVTPNTTYTIGDYYKSSAVTQMVIQITDTAGKLSYLDLGQVPTSAEWKQTTFTFTTPPTAKKVTLFHLIKSNGYLQTDNFTLAKGATVPTPSPTQMPTITLTPTPTSTQEVNLITNQSVEVAKTNDATVPNSWQKGGWGSNVRNFEYLSTNGQNGAKSVKVTVSNYVSGDAKWYFNPVKVTPNTKYIFKDYYKSDTTCTPVLVVKTTAGKTIYTDLTQAAPSNDWKEYQVSFVTPDDAATITIYRLLTSNGYLQTDNFSLSIAPADPYVPIVDHVPNASMEVASLDESKPVDWMTNSWDITAKFDYLSTGHIGNKSVQTTVSAAGGGDAKWYFQPQALPSNKEYLFTDWYKSDVQTSVVVQITNTDGTIHYITLRNADPSSTWKQYKDSFTVPSTADVVTVFHIIKTIGFLTIDDYSITDYTPEGFDRPLLTLTFDDGWEDNHDTVLPLLTEFGYKSTQFYATSYIEGTGKDQKIRDFLNAGHEIGSHTVTHPDLTTLTPDQLDYELIHSKNYLREITEANIKNFASPYGAYNSSVVAKTQSMYKSHRSVDVGYNTNDNLDIYKLKVQNILNTTTADDVASWVAKAQRDKAWLILVYHRVGDNPGAYDTSPTIFRQQLEKIKTSGIAVLTMDKALNEVATQ